MRVRINGKEEEIKEGGRLLDFINEKGLNPSTLVIEYNEKILTQQDYEKITFQPGDRVEILRFVGGG